MPNFGGCLAQQDNPHKSWLSGLAYLLGTMILKNCCMMTAEYSSLQSPFLVARQYIRSLEPDQHHILT